MPEPQDAHAPSTLPAPARRALDAYRRRLADPADARPIVVAWAPGRINLIGEHTDYNDGYVLPAAIDCVVALAGRPNPDAAQLDTRLYSAHHDEVARFSSDPAALAAPTDPSLPTWAAYVRGILAQLAALPDESTTPPFAAAIAGDVPLGAGLSSSAALEVAAATFAAALGGPALPPLDTALLCQRAENTAVGVQSGIMDQATACLGRPDATILLDCRSLAYEYVPLNLPDVVLALYDTNVPHTLAASAYNERRRQCEEAVALLAAQIHRDEPDRSIRSLRDVTPDDLAEHAAVLPDVLLRRARHVLGENERVLMAVEALRAGDAPTLGELLLASHASLRDDYAVSCPELDAVVEIAGAVPGVLGARMMGAGFGGSALILARTDAVPALDAALARDYLARTGRTGAFTVCRIAGGPGRATVSAR